MHGYWMIITVEAICPKATYSILHDDGLWMLYMATATCTYVADY